MLNYQIYKKGKQIPFENENNYFQNKIFETLFILHGLYVRGKNWQTFSSGDRKLPS